MADHAKQTGVALEKAYQFVLWLVAVKRQQNRRRSQAYGR
jgi:hypothetical protein